MNPEILLYIIKIITGGVVAFLAIFAMSKTRDASWMFLITGFLLTYAVTVYELLLKLGIFSKPGLAVGGIPVMDIITSVVPGIFFIIGFIIKISKK